MLILLWRKQLVVGAQRGQQRLLCLLSLGAPFVVHGPVGVGLRVRQLALVGGHSVLVLQHFVVARVFEIVRGLVQRLLGRLSRFIALHILGCLELG